MPGDVLEKPVTAEDVLHEFRKLRSDVKEAVEEGVRAANRAIRHGRHAAEDAVEEAKHTIKQRPVQTIGIAFAAGALAGCFLGWIAFRER
jgi:ElaB/YqjD/DUF883 family membrane-anchored ribosome-binding protein